ncbi:MAG: hypothetical protein QXW70_02775 [Candidatus Anstonellales archaeon]
MRKNSVATTNKSNSKKNSTFEINKVEQEVLKNGFRSSSGRRGRPSIFSSEKMRELVRVAYSDYYTIRELATIFGVSRTSISRALEKAEQLGIASEILLPHLRI